ncbi:hypothetical protein FIBSPDRAFT_968740 [Athelia psychrophila]|uniref:Uncharacterized protein n=1 Tax=Athelia psychrophila TaxID=1759441 RepID=A0A167U9Q0_9AGAM|nr:hypothetical protein FIBSPDRAFT_968740 [Fibularhizoctonia sp. CBS 109695]
MSAYQDPYSLVNGICRVSMVLLQDLSMDASDHVTSDTLIPLDTEGIRLLLDSYWQCLPGALQTFVDDDERTQESLRRVAQLSNLLQGQLTPEQLDFVHNLISLNVPAADIAGVMERMREEGEDREANQRMGLGMERGVLGRGDVKSAPEHEALPDYEPPRQQHRKRSSNLGSDGILDGLSSPTINISTPRCADKGMQAPDAELQVSSLPGQYDLSRKAIEEARPSTLGGTFCNQIKDRTAAAINSLLLNRHPLAQRTRNDNITPIELRKQLDDLYPPEVIVAVLPKRLHRSLGYTPLLRLSELVHHTLKQPALLQEAHMILELGLGSGCV